MGHSSSDAAAKDVKMVLLEEECVKYMVQRSSVNYASAKDAQTMLGKEECA